MAKRRAQGEGTLFHRADGIWIGRIRLETGERKQVAAKTQAEARRKLQEIRTAAAQGLPVNTSRQTVGQFLQQWLQESVKPRRRRSTYTGYEVNVRRHIVPHIGSVPLARLTPQHVQRMLNELDQSGLSPRSVQYVRATLRVGLQQAAKWGLVARNAAALVDPPRFERAEVQPFTPQEVWHFLDTVAGDRLEALYAVALALGLRQGEALGLCWADVDLERGRLRVRQQLQRIDGTLQLVEVKTKRSKRPSELPPVLVEHLRAHRKRQLSQRLLLGTLWQDSDLVFTTGRGTPLDGSNVWRYFQRHLRRAGIEPKRFHDLRHTCASLLLAQGIPLHEVSDLLGHSGIQITADIYGHLYEERRREAADRMNTLLWGAR